MAAGIFVIEGMTFMIPKFAISMADDGSISSDVRVELRYDACVTWAGIALEHRERTKECFARRRAAWSDDGEEVERGPALEAEFRSSMQAVVAAATSLDALYDIVKKHAPIPQATLEAWSKNRTARHSRIAETLRAAFKIRPQDAKPLKQNLQGIYVLRDAAVHPSGLGQPPAPHPDLPIATEWRLVTFRADVADVIVCCALGILWDLSGASKYRSEEIGNYMKGLRGRLEKLLPDGRPMPMVDRVNLHLPPTRRGAAASRGP